MSKVLIDAHPSAVKFNELGAQVIGETVIPGPETQVYLQVPANGLYYRHSGRLLTSEEKGDLVERARNGFNLGAFFELQRVGKVTRQSPNIVTRRWTNPVHSLETPAVAGLVAIRWIDGDTLHHAIPRNQERAPVSVTVQSWSKDTVLGSDFAHNPSGTCNSKIQSAAPEDPALAFMESALRAYRSLLPAS